MTCRATRLAAVVTFVGTAAAPVATLEAGFGQASARALVRIWNVPGEAVSSPAADETTAYALMSRTHEVVAVEAATGRVRWRRSTNESGFGGSGAAVVVSGSVVVVGDYNLLGIDRRSGQLRWRFVPNDGYGPGFYLSYAATEDGLVFAGSPSGHVYALETETGRLRWATAVADDGKTTIYTPRFRGRLVAAGYTDFVAPSRGGLILLSADTGRVLWTRAFPTPRDRSLGVGWAGGPVFAGNVVAVAAGDGIIHAYDLQSGEERWSIPPLSRHPANLIDPERDSRGLAIAGGLLVSGSLTGVIVAYDLETREERWRQDSSRLGSVIFRIEATEDLVYVPFAGGTLVALDARDGTEQWRVGDWKASILWPPVLWNELVIVSGALDGLTAFHATR